MQQNQYIAKLLQKVGPYKLLSASHKNQDSAMCVCVCGGEVILEVASREAYSAWSDSNSLQTALCLWLTSDNILRFTCTVFTTLGVNKTAV